MRISDWSSDVFSSDLSIAGLLRRPQDGSAKARWTSMGSRMAWSLSMEWPRLALQPFRLGGGDLRAAKDDDTDADDGHQAAGDQGERQALAKADDTREHAEGLHQQRRRHDLVHLVASHPPVPVAVANRHHDDGLVTDRSVATDVGLLSNLPLA